jgi:hypothetical protein
MLLPSHTFFLLTNKRILDLFVSLSFQRGFLPRRASVNSCWIGSQQVLIMNALLQQAQSTFVTLAGGEPSWDGSHHLTY